MKIIKKNVYYCEFCNKKSLKSVKDHEKHCTNNLDRDCKLCKEKYNYREIIDKLKQRFVFMETTKVNEDDFGVGEFIDVSISWVTDKISGKEVLDLVNGCPICALTIIKGLAKNKNESRLLNIDFDYGKELGSWWTEINGLLREEMYY